MGWAGARASYPDELLQQLYTLCRGKLNLLVVDDDEQMLELLQESVRSPLCTVHCASTVEQARDQLNRSDLQWHCLLLDLLLGNGQTALQLIPGSLRPPFCLCVTGVAGYELVSQAMLAGASFVFGKDGSMATLAGVVAVYAALGFVLRHGMAEPQRRVFDVLTANDEIADTTAWARLACVSERSLQTMCQQCCGLAPRYVLPLFNALAWAARPGTWRQGAVPGSAVVQKAIAFVLRNRESYVEIAAAPLVATASPQSA